jgi:two-component system sensor kinase FixL
MAEQHMSNKTDTQWLRNGLISAFLFLCVFLLDISQPLGVAIGVTYVPLILLSLLFGNKKIPFILAILTTILIILGIFLSPHEGINLINPLINRILSIMAIWVIALALYLNKLTQIKLEETEESLTLGWKGAGDGMWDWNISSNHMSYSDRFKELLGYAPHEMTHDFNEWSGRLHEDDKKKTLDSLQKHIKNKTVYESEYRLRTKSGEWRWFLMRGIGLFNDSGDATRMAGSLRDITLSKQEVIERDRLIKSLEQSNAALDDFAYVASHDLKAPLRVIDNTSSWLEEDLADSLDDDSKENLELLRNRTKRMEKLLDDLLEYSRVGREKNRDYSTETTGATLIEDMVPLLDMPPGFTLDVSNNFKMINLVQMPLQQIFLNLINNALKHHDKKNGVISLDVIRKGQLCTFTVQDDGPGIEPEFHEQVFKMFKTLKSRDEVEGSGMGLALVRKHIEYAGGKITLQSHKGGGALFSFTWPIKANGRMYDN